MPQLPTHLNPAAPKGLKGEVLGPAGRSVFRRAKERHAAFAQHPDMASVLTALGSSDRSGVERRDQLVRAMLDERSRGEASVWSSVLAVAFYPMLSALRNRLACAELSKNDLDQIVMEAFFVTLASYNPRTWVDRTPIRIAHNTRKRVFACLRQELGAWKARQRQAEDVKATPERVPAGSIGSAPLGIDVDAVLAAIPACGPKEGAEVLMATDFGTESLRAVVLRMVGEPQDGERTYERLKRMRSRMKRRLREAIVASPMAR